MTTITGFKFDAAAGASEMVDLFKELSEKQLITLLDAAIITWPEGSRRPNTRHLHELAGEEALDDAFWGLFFSLIFFVPFLGMAFSAAMGALVGHFSQYGIDKGFIKVTQEEVTEGESAIFLLTAEAVPDWVVELVAECGLDGALFCTNLSEQQEAQLREDFNGQVKMENSPGNLSFQPV